MKILIDIPNDVYYRLTVEDPDEEDLSINTIIDDFNELINSLKNGEVISNKKESEEAI